MNAIAIFFKAKVPGAAGADLFATAVDVGGYTTTGGTYVAPHRSIRHKRRDRPTVKDDGQPDLFAARKPVQPDLFAAPPPKAAPAPTPAPPPEPAAEEAAPNRAEPRATPPAENHAAQLGQREQLDRLRAKLNQVAMELGGRLHAAMTRAEAFTRAGSNARSSYFGRGTTSWRKQDEATFQRLLRVELAKEAPSLRAAFRRYDRSMEAQAEAARRLGVNDDWRPSALRAADVEPLRTMLAGGAGPAHTGKPAWADLAQPPAEGDPLAVQDGGPVSRNAAEPAAPVAIAAPVAEFGVPPGTKPAARKRMNAEALALLKAKADGDMTAEDRQVLARYSGQGGVGDSLNEFYTPPEVAGAMWELLAGLGFKGGDVLEPSSGTGVFLHTAPAGARVQAVELDATSARIAGILHPGHDVQHASLERFATQDGRKFDAVIGNVPFCVRGSMIRDDKPDIPRAEQYFCDTALDKTKDGGLVALIVPTGIMDGRTTRAFRERLLRKGEFIGAMRLPNTAFADAGTEVTTDIVVFRKRPQDVAGALGTVTPDVMKALGQWDDEYLAGSYFTDGRGRSSIFGSMEEGWRAKAGIGQDITVNGSMEGVPEAIAAWRPAEAEGVASGDTVTVQRILDTLADDPAAQRRAYNGALKPPYQQAKVGDVRVMDGIRYVLRGEPPRWHRADSDVPEAVQDAITIGDMLHRLEGSDAATRDLDRAKLMEALDDFVREHGIPSKSKELAAWLGAPQLAVRAGDDAGTHGDRVKEAQRRTARLLGAVDPSGRYSDLVTGRQEEAPTASVETHAERLSLEGGGFSAAELAQAAGISRDDALDHLHASPSYAQDPDTGRWATRDTYLGGDLWPKLDAVRAALAKPDVPPAERARWTRQAEALEGAIDPQSLDDVEIAINSGFIKPHVIQAWLNAKRQASAEAGGGKFWSAEARVTFGNGVWSIIGVPGTGTNQWSRVDDGELLEKWLNRAGTRREDKPTIDGLNRRFRDWLLGSELRGEVEEHYNRTHRGFVPPAYSDSPLPIAGLNPALDVNGYHFSGIRWALEAGSGIIAADVGLGKTGRGLMLAKLAKQTGQAKKPTFVVPKSVMSNWLAEAEFWFPGSRVLTIGESYSRNAKGELVAKADDAATRRRKLHDMRQNDYDFVFISQPAWNDIDVDPIKKGEYANSDFWAQRGDSLGGAGSKRLRDIRERYEQAVAKRDFTKREDTLYFGDLGIDMLLLDEGHAYKNLFSARQRWGQPVKFLGGSGESNRALDTMFKTRELREATGGKGVFMLTATPTKNSPLEVYSMLSHVAPQAFENMGIKNSEEFIDRFCEFEEDRILTTEGTIEPAMVVKGFKNLGELRSVMRRYIDRKTAEDVGLVLPKAEVSEVFVDMTPQQKAVYHELRAAAAKTKGDADGDGHIFSVMSKMGKASIDLGLLPGHPLDAPSPKIAACVERVVANKADGGQIIFCDSVETHERIKRDLVAAGIPAARIGIINAEAASASSARQAITDKFNRGELDVVIGNVTMSEGLNMQKVTSDIHHLDIPWEPAAVQQRNGRGRRQGNKRAAIRLHTYLARGSFDGYRWQTVAAKKDWQDMLWNGGDRVENLARQGAISRDDMLIMLSADPDAERAKLAEDKAKALKLHQAAERQTMVETLGRYKRMKRSLEELRAKADRGEAREADAETMRRLATKSQRLRDQLEASPDFTHKGLLDDDTPVILEPVQNIAWKEGSAFEVHPGPDAPIDKGPEPTKWVVTGVDPEAGNIIARPYADIAGRHIYVKGADMRSGVTPFEHSKEAESAEIARVLEERTKLAQAQGRKAAEESLDIADFKKMGPDTVQSLYPTIQARMKQALRDYKTKGYRQNWGLFDPVTGKASMARDYQARNAIDHADLLLPTAAHEEAAINAMVDAQLASRLTTKYDTGRRRGAWGAPKVAGVERQYPGQHGMEASFHNPWEAVIKDIFGDAAVSKAKRTLADRVVERVRSAPDFHAAYEAAAAMWEPGAHLPATAKLPVAVIRALRERAEAEGLRDKTVFDVMAGRPKNTIHSEAFKPGSQSYTWNEPRNTLGKMLDEMTPATARPVEA